MFAFANAKLLAFLGVFVIGAGGIAATVYLDRTSDDSTIAQSPVSDEEADASEEANPPQDTDTQATAQTAQPDRPVAEEQEVAVLSEPDVAEPIDVAPAIDSGPSMSPSVDILRVEPDGSFVIAGAAGPNAKIDIVVDGDVLLSVVADANGDWTALGDTLLPAGDHLMTLHATEPGRDIARSDIEISVGIAQDGSTPLVAIAEPGQPSEIVQQPEITTEPDTVEVASADAVIETEQAEAVLEEADIVSATSDPVSEAPQEEIAAETETPVETDVATSEPEPVVGADTGIARADTTITLVEVENQDTVHVTGEGEPGDTVRVYINGSHAGDALADANGAWSLTIGRELPPGRYTVRADSIEPNDGSVIARATVRFDRVQLIAAEDVQNRPAADRSVQEVAETGDTPAAEQQTDGEQTAAVSTETTASPSAATDVAATSATEEIPQIIIERGDNLWRIARRHYGAGIRYTMIFEANRNQIDDPDLIFPDQVFTIPVLEDDDTDPENG